MCAGDYNKINCSSLSIVLYQFWYGQTVFTVNWSLHHRIIKNAWQIVVGTQWGIIKAQQTDFLGWNYVKYIEWLVPGNWSIESWLMLCTVNFMGQKKVPTIFIYRCRQVYSHEPEVKWNFYLLPCITSAHKKMRGE